jgi:5-methyltetrahydrofolate--homocysteine methyltransferase
MINEILFRLGAREILLVDGATGTMLMERGLAPGECPESVNLAFHNIVTDVAREYFNAGAMIIETNTFGASPLKLLQYGLADKTEEINHKAVMAAREAVASLAYVAGSVGPTGRTLKPHGDVDPTDVYRGYLRQIKALADAGVDVICVETMTDLNEATLAIEAAKTVARTLPVMATMTFDKTPRGYFTIMGVDIPTAVKGLTEAGASIIGSNCGHGSDQMLEITKEFRRHTQLPLLIQPNAGVPELQGNTAVYPETPEYMAEMAKEILEAGASLFGGCCGTTPAHIRAIRRTVNAFMDRQGPSSGWSGND